MTGQPDPCGASGSAAYPPLTEGPSQPVNHASEPAPPIPPVSALDQSATARKIDAQRRRLNRLEELLSLTKRRDLAERCLSAEARAAWLASLFPARESAYMKGYRQGYMDAVLRPIPDPPLSADSAQSRSSDAGSSSSPSVAPTDSLPDAKGQEPA